MLPSVAIGSTLALHTRHTAKDSSEITPTTSAPWTVVQSSERSSSATSPIPSMFSNLAPSFEKDIE